MRKDGVNTVKIFHFTEGGLLLKKQKLDFREEETGEDPGPHISSVSGRILWEVACFFRALPKFEALIYLTDRLISIKSGDHNRALYT